MVEIHLAQEVRRLSTNHPGVQVQNQVVNAINRHIETPATALILVVAERIECHSGAGMAAGAILGDISCVCLQHVPAVFIFSYI